MFGLTQSGLAFLATSVTPSVQPKYQPPIKAVVSDYPGVKDPRTNVEAPPAIMGHGFPQTVVVYNQCLGCIGETLERAIRGAFATKGVLNLVVADEQDAYRKMVASIPGATAIYADPSSVKDLGLRFSPRVYGFDVSGKLSYLQSDPSKSLSEAIDECRAKIHQNN